MKELVEVIAKALVDHPEEVSVNEKNEGRTIVLELHVAEGDMGKVIGKQGRIAKAIRSVVKACSVWKQSAGFISAGKCSALPTICSGPPLWPGTWSASTA